VKSLLHPGDSQIVIPEVCEEDIPVHEAVDMDNRLEDIPNLFDDYDSC
jgi:hypothetical protein